MKLLPLAVFLLLSLASLKAQHLDNPAVDGLLIYKERKYYPDNLAIATEYTNVSNFSRVTHVFLFHGGHIQLPDDAEALFIAYPGRSSDRKEEVMPLLDIADTRYPQYHKILSKIRNEWNMTAPQKTSALTVASESRKNWAQTAIASMSHAVHTLFNSGPFASKLDPAPTPQAAMEKNDTNADTTTPFKPHPDNYQQNMQTIQDYYKKAGDLQ